MVNYATILEELRRAEVERPALGDVIKLHVDLITIQARAAGAERLPTPDRRTLDARLIAGQPALTADDVVVDPSAFTDLALQVIQITTQHRPDLAAPMSSISEWLPGKRQAITALVRQFMSAGRLCQAEQAGLGGSLVSFVFNNALHPHLRAQADLLSPGIDETLWYRGLCPVCGGAPDLSALSKSSGERRLLCSRCDMEWPFYRTACPFCAEDERIFYYAREAPYRVYVCEACRRYLKTVDLREVEGQRLLPVERILTIQADVEARAAGWTSSDT